MRHPLRPAGTRAGCLAEGAGHSRGRAGEHLHVRHGRDGSRQHGQVKESLEVSVSVTATVAETAVLNMLQAQQGQFRNRENTLSNQLV